jgi:hypothetical protein
MIWFYIEYMLRNTKINKERRKHDFDHEYVPCVVDTIPSFMTEL